MTDETVKTLAARVGGVVHGDGALPIRGVADLRVAGPHDIGFVRERRYVELASKSGAGAVIVAEILDLPKPQIVVADVGAAFSRIAILFHPLQRAERHDVHPTACIDSSAILETPVEVGPHVVIGARTRVGAGSVLRAGVVLGDDVTLGEGCVLMPRVVLYARVRVGRRVIVHAGAVIGADGFGYAREGERWEKVPQLGDVDIADDVEIGANTAIDCGALGSTRIGRGTKIDNLVHIGHNCAIGEDCVIAGFSAFSGSTIIGDRVTIAGHVVTAGHQRIADDVRIGGNSVVRGDVPEAGDYMGYPLQPRARWARTLGAIDRLSDIRGRLRDAKPDDR